MKYESLHTHTLISDGQQTHLEVLATAKKYGFGLIVFTDHDILPRTSDLRMLEKYSDEVKWKIGIEISAGWPQELGGGPANLLHVLALDIDPDNRALQAYCQEATEARTERMRRTVTNLKGQGFNISLDRCLDIAGEGAAASPHLVRALLEHEKNQTILLDLFQEMQMVAGKPNAEPKLIQQFADLKYRYEEQGPKALVYGLLLSTEAYVPGIYVPYLFFKDLDQTVSLIRQAGGVAILAHWPTVRQKIDEPALDKMLGANRLDGLEVRSGFTASPTVEDDEKALKQIASQHNKLITIGIDSHEEADFEKFVSNQDLAAKTEGLWEQVIKFKG